MSLMVVLTSCRSLRIPQVLSQIDKLTSHLNLGDAGKDSDSVELSISSSELSWMNIAGLFNGDNKVTTTITSASSAVSATHNAHVTTNTPQRATCVDILNEHVLPASFGDDGSARSSPFIPRSHGSWDTLPSPSTCDNSRCAGEAKGSADSKWESPGCTCTSSVPLHRAESLPVHRHLHNAYNRHGSSLNKNNPPKQAKTLQDVHLMLTNGSLTSNGSLPGGNFLSDDADRLNHRQSIDRGFAFKEKRDNCTQTAKERVRFNDEVEYRRFCPELDGTIGLPQGNLYCGPGTPPARVASTTLHEESFMTVGLGGLRTRVHTGMQTGQCTADNLKPKTILRKPL
uniref:protein Largen n=1 Tax=Myxine glutinosa TaxID=7769 RepID=UPI00358DE0A2